MDTPAESSMTTLLLSPRHSEDSRLLWRTAVALGWQVQRVHNWEIPKIALNDIAIYGEPLLCRHLSQRLRLRLDEPPLNWLPQVPTHLRKRDVRLCELGEARLISHPAFIKPADEKGLDARVYLSGHELPGADLYPDSLPVLVQEIVSWRHEFRCFVLGSSILTAGAYWFDYKIAQDANGQWLADIPEIAEAASFCSLALVDPDFPRLNAFVLDVGLTADRGWAVIEANAACSSGLYGCDPVEALKVIHAAVRNL